MNEFLDALPPKIFAFGNDGKWHEVVILFDSLSKKFYFSLARSESTFPKYLIRDPNYNASAKDRKWLEFSVYGISCWKFICDDIASHGGDALFIDYGYTEAEIPDTFTLRVQVLINSYAYHEHKQVDVFHKPGQCDITYDIDFPLLLAFQTEDNIISQPTPMCDFLNTFGFQERAKFLIENSKSDEQEKIRKFLNMLTSPDQMGRRFKVITINGD
ncbi:NADH dehydrogenase [ubiquinone] complex I, assembly factor 7 [Thelohanellus kitauei]|uniref:Protein arginine methyltransferase NDUFAF7 n=1 Tax=Thelohanellus kitauei TaxID=669202 RepID=A0A0C2MVL8_THEKT|nr:NADH dehydrogenase [ubiquinone] complex I, assembly factor 7 [Thelohanellus kitauei]